jgi:hypothetical protein
MEARLAAPRGTWSGFEETPPLRRFCLREDGQNYGGWFHNGHAVWQNEDTFPLDAYVSGARSRT